MDEAGFAKTIIAADGRPLLVSRRAEKLPLEVFEKALEELREERDRHVVGED